MQALQAQPHGEPHHAHQASWSSWGRLLRLSWMVGLVISCLAASVQAQAQPSAASKPTPSKAAPNKAAPKKADDSPYAESEPKPAELSPEEKKSRARELLISAIALVKAGRCNEAVHRLDSSLELYDSPATRVYKARCLLTLRRFIEARAIAAGARERAHQERKAALLAEDEKRAEALLKRAKEADRIAQQASKRICRLTILVPSSSRAQNPVIQYQFLPKLSDTRSEPVTLRQERHNRAQELDPGHYRIIVSASRMNTWTTEIHLAAEGGHATITVPALTEAEQLTAPPSPGLSPRRVAATTFGIVGLTSMAAGVAMGASILQIDSSNMSSIRDRSAASLVAIGAGAAAVGLAGVLWVVGEPQQEGDASVGVMLSPAMTGVRVRF